MALPAELAQPRAVCLVSGGMDSAVTLAEARAAGFACYALSFRYGQRHLIELDAARAVAAALGAVEHLFVDIDLSALGGSALTDAIEVPKDRDPHQMKSAGVPVTYVPARNLVFLSVAVAWAELLGARHLYLGVNAVDYSGYPDCRPEFLRAFEAVARLGTVAGAEQGHAFEVHAPLLQLDKRAIVLRALELEVDLGLTHTCYDPGIDDEGRPISCGRCDACLLRLKGFEEAELTDPLPYAAR